MDRNLGATLGDEWVGSDRRDEMTGFYYPFGHYIGFTYYDYYEKGDTGGWRMIDTYAYHPEKPYILQGNKHRSFSPGTSSEAALWSRLWNRPGDNKKTMYDPCPTDFF